MWLQRTRDVASGTLTDHAAGNAGVADGGEAEEEAAGSKAGGGGSRSLREKLAEAREEIRSLEAEIALLKGNSPAGEEGAGGPGGRPVSPEERAKQLRALIPKLLEKKDGAALMALMKELAALGEAGYAGAMQIAEIFRRQFGNGDRALGVAKVQFNKAFGAAMAPLLKWALENPEKASPWFRAHSVNMLYWISDVDAGPILLAALGKEKDANVSASMANYLEHLAKPEMVGDLLAAARSHSDRPRTLQPILDSLIAIHTTESEAALRDLAGDSDPTLRSEAQLALIEFSPPAPGVMVTLTQPKSQAESLGIRRGDIIVSYDGKPVESLDALRRQVMQKPGSQIVTLMVNREGQLVPIQLKGGRIGIDGKYVKP